MGFRGSGSGWIGLLLGEEARRGLLDRSIHWWVGMVEGKKEAIRSLWYHTICGGQTNGSIDPSEPTHTGGMRRRLQLVEATAEGHRSIGK